MATTISNPHDTDDSQRGIDDIRAGESERASQQQRGIFFTLVVIVSFIALVLVGFVYKITSPRILSSIELQVNGARVLDTPRKFHWPSLINQEGRTVSAGIFEGKWTIAYFGFTHCPYICPMTLSELTKTSHQLKPSIAKGVQLFLVTVDPARDTPDRMKDYLMAFEADITGLTGEFIGIKRLANALNVPFQKMPEGDSYTMDHGSQLVLINPNGHYHGFFDPGIKSDQLTLTLQSIITNY
ncbi:SCO family protein [Marinibactrum halimedae]|uniref:SCO family protein n=1 Tax=Marinibactrum halimedae TaxID=1444977 RepID=A0AA37T3R6_9GAMM|nr:SCO family protein [Marinibactrum halimedae]MCD9461055.1 SCO family protein [Marinibactrum halimedae]GLS24433.1 hypothetical protein GCM10007877_01440 [Marinibactrum halimedae]